MATEFKYSIDKTAPEALVVTCSDARFQTAFRRFGVEELGLANYYPLALGGGTHALGAKGTSPEDYATLYRQIKFFIEEIPLKLVVLINHQDCRWYQGHGDLSALDADIRGQADLETSKGILSAGFPGVEVRAFWAGLDGRTVTFSEVGEPIWLRSGDLIREPKPWLA